MRLLVITVVAVLLAACSTTTDHDRVDRVRPGGCPQFVQARADCMPVGGVSGVEYVSTPDKKAAPATGATGSGMPSGK